MLGEVFRALYQNFYTPLETDHHQRTEQIHYELIHRLEKTDRIRVLEIIDLKDAYAELLSIDSFIAGFRLAWNITNELNIKEDLL